MPDINLRVVFLDSDGEGRPEPMDVSSEVNRAPAEPHFLSAFLFLALRWARTAADAVFVSPPGSCKKAVTDSINNQLYCAEADALSSDFAGGCALGYPRSEPDQGRRMVREASGPDT